MSGSERPPRVLLATTRDWLAASIEGVLDHGSVELRRAATVAELEERVGTAQPDVIVLDLELAGADTPELCRRLSEGRAGADTPLVVYSSDLRDEELEADVIEAGAWTVLEEPVRSQVLLATLRRFIEIGCARPTSPRRRLAARRENLPDLEGVLSRLPLLEALAKRYGSPLSIVALGPGRLGSGELLDRQRRRTAELCMEELRKADLFGWLDDDADIIVIAYGASREGARQLARRLARRAAEESEIERPEQALSAGIAEIEPEARTEQTPAGKAGPNGSPEFIDAARRALRRARSTGGGIEFAS